MAKIHSLEDLDKLALALSQEKLVAFPTQTVYGLGASAYCESSVLKIFAAKKRPLTDPIIVHTLSAGEAERLVRLGKFKPLFWQLAEAFWPGPLTIVLEANWQILPRVLGGGTEFVGVRVPAHPLARQFIERANVPVAAPSANLFGHVSPTTALHVLDDFRDNPDVLILDGGACEYGIESTVVKPVDDGEGFALQVLREGGISLTELKARFKDLTVSKVVAVRSAAQKMESPGQLLKHYSPNIPCFIGCLQKEATVQLRTSAVLSFSTKFDSLREKCKQYYRVGEHFGRTEGESKTRAWMRELYALLRLAEKGEAEQVLVLWEGAREGSVWDKLFRASSGEQRGYL